MGLGRLIELTGLGLSLNGLSFTVEPLRSTHSGSLIRLRKDEVAICEAKAGIVRNDLERLFGLLHITFVGLFEGRDGGVDISTYRDEKTGDVVRRLVDEIGLKQDN